MAAVPPRICFPARTQCLELIRSFCREVLESHGLDQTVHRRVVLAIDEAVSNVVEHAYHKAGERDGEPSSSMIELELDVEPDRVVARILDCGVPFDPRASISDPPGAAKGRSRKGRPRENGGSCPSQEPASHLPHRGYGLHLIRLIMDRIDYQRTARGENVLVLTKLLKKG